MYPEKPKSLIILNGKSSIFANDSVKIACCMSQHDYNKTGGENYFHRLEIFQQQFMIRTNCENYFSPT